MKTIFTYKSRHGDFAAAMSAKGRRKCLLLPELTTGVEIQGLRSRIWRKQHEPHLVKNVSPKFQRLLSKWRNKKVKPEVEEEEPKPATGSGGKRGKRGGKKAAPKSMKKKEGSRITKSTNTAVYVDTGVDILPGMKRYASGMEQDLLRLVGRGVKKTVKPPRINGLGVLLALETGNDPTPEFDRRSTTKTAKILVTADRSGSCNDFSQFSAGFAVVMSELPQIDVYCLFNGNGTLVSQGGIASMNYHTIDELPRIAAAAYEGYDVVLYFGDADAYGTLLIAAQEYGCKIVAFDSYCASFSGGKAIMAEMKTFPSGGALLWYTHCSAKDPASIAAVVKHAANRL